MSLNNILLSYATCSLGDPNDPTSHSLESKLTAIANAGFSAIELSMPDLLPFASAHHGREIKPDDYAALATAAHAVQALCAARNLSILVLQPFANFEGWPEQQREEALARARGWVQIMRACGCDMLQVGSTDTPLAKLQPAYADSDSVSEDLRDRIVADLQTLADLLATHGLRIAYENWCWSSHAPTWRTVWDIVQRVDRANVGLCLDTFQTAGSEWADPTRESGLMVGLEAPSTHEEAQQRWERSLADLSAEVPADKIFFFQISDAYRPKPQALDVKVVDEMPPRSRWSHSFRPLPFDGGYLPVVDVTRAVLKTGFRGWFSYEVFDAGQDGKRREFDIDADSRRAMEKHRELMEACAETANVEKQSDSR